MSRFLAAVAMVWMAGCARPAEVDFRGSGTFGTVPVGESRSIAMSLANQGDEAADVVLETEGDFTVEPSTLRLEKKATALVTLTFTPREVGAREGRLVASFRDRQRALLLNGTGTGPRLRAVDRVQFARSVIFTGVPPQPVRAFTWLENRGTEGTTLTLGSPVIDGPAGLCVGEFVDGACQAWTPSALSAGESVRLPLSFRPSVTGDARWTVTISSNDPVSSERRIEVLATTEERDPGCITISPTTLDFGTVRLTCSSESRTFTIFNTCSRSLELAAPRIAGSSEFVVMNGWPTGATVEPGSSVLIQLAYRPTDFGADTGALVLSEVGSVENVVALFGRGDAAAQQNDSFVDVAPIVSDVLVMVDSSPSFVGRRASVRTNLERLASSLAYRRACNDIRLGIAAADGDASAMVELQRNDAGRAWNSSSDPAFVERVLSAFDTLPVGSETEACVGPAANLIADAGLRSRFSGLCITDALEQTPNPAASLQRIRDLTDGGTNKVFWSVVGGVNSTCGVEAVDDGVHASLLNHPGGVIDVCNADWANHFVSSSGCLYVPRDQFFLTGRPEGAIGVRLDGAALPASSWTYDAASNSVRILVPRVLDRDRRIEVSYNLACVP